MNLKEAARLKPGAIVREAWSPSTKGRRGIVLTKNHVLENHMAKVLCQDKDERYDVLVHWLDGPRRPDWRISPRQNPEKCQSWELMVVSHTK
tara:strand:- start:421 stop:696 length:276 start_codon:yes stop_codon:yes gene_type:complete